MGKTGAYEKFFARVGSGLTQKNPNRLEMLSKDKHSRLLSPFVNCGRKMLYNIGPSLEGRHKVAVAFLVFLSETDTKTQGILKGGSITVPLTSCLTG